MDSISINNTSFSPDKSETAKSTLEPIKIEEQVPVPVNTIPSILDFENFEAIKAALEKATTYQEQIVMSYVLPLNYDSATQRYVLVPNAEAIYQYKRDNITNYQPVSSSLVPPPLNPDKYTVSPLMQWWEGKKLAERNNNELLHSMQLYWLTVASTLNEVKDNLMFGKSSKEQISTVTDAIATAHLCSDWYGATLREKIRMNLQYINNDCYNHYCHNENVFYDKLVSLIKDPEIYTYLQNKVREELSYGTRYFTYFLSVLGINK